MSPTAHTVLSLLSTARKSYRGRKRQACLFCQQGRQAGFSRLVQNTVQNMYKNSYSLRDGQIAGEDRQV